MTTTVEKSVTLSRTQGGWIDYERRLGGYPGTLTFEGGMDGISRAEVEVTIRKDETGDVMPVASRVVLESEHGVSQRAAAAWTGRLTRFALASLTAPTIEVDGEQRPAPMDSAGVPDEQVRWLQSRAKWPNVEPIDDDRRVDYVAVLDAFERGGYREVERLDGCSSRNTAYQWVHRARKLAEKEGG